MLPQEAAKNKKDAQASSYTFGFYTTKVQSTGETRFTVIFSDIFFHFSLLLLHHHYHRWTCLQQCCTTR